MGETLDQGSSQRAPAAGRSSSCTHSPPSRLHAAPACPRVLPSTALASARRRSPIVAYYDSAFKRQLHPRRLRRRLAPRPHPSALPTPEALLRGARPSSSSSAAPAPSVPPPRCPSTRRAPAAASPVVELHRLCRAPSLPEVPCSTAHLYGSLTQLFGCLPRRSRCLADLKFVSANPSALDCFTHL